MGAYYTKEDITEYIGRNTIVPFLMDATKKTTANAFKTNGSVWQYLQQSGDRYIYDAVKHGHETPRYPVLMPTEPCLIRATGLFAL